jgi:uridylate kinase
MAKNGVDGVYDDDPRTNPKAKKLDHISFDEMLRQGLKVMDPAAVSLCQQNNIPILVFRFC